MREKIRVLLSGITDLSFVSARATVTQLRAAAVTQLRAPVGTKIHVWISVPAVRKKNTLALIVCSHHREECVATENRRRLPFWCPSTSRGTFPEMGRDSHSTATNFSLLLFVSFIRSFQDVHFD